MKQLNKLEELYKIDKNILTIQDLGMIWQIGDRKKLLENIKYYLRTGKLKKIQRGIYSRSKNYDFFELALKLMPLSYISLNTALAKYGLIFQYYDSIESIALKNRKFEIDNQKFVYHKVKADIFFNSIAIKKEKGFLIASKERAICDTLYLKPNFAFDNLNSIDFKMLKSISKIYKNKNLELRIRDLIKKYNA